MPERSRRRPSAFYRYCIIPSIVPPNTTSQDKKIKIERALQAFGPEGRNRDEAYTALYEDGRQVLSAYLRRKGTSAEEAEDIIQNVFSRILKNQERLRFDSLSAWYGYLFESARNGAKDVGGHVSEPLLNEPIDPHVDPFQLVARILEGERLRDVADCVWFGEKPTDCATRCLAAQYLFVEGKSPEWVFSFARSSRADSKPSTTEGLKEWVGFPWILRKVAFEALHLPNDQLTTHLLGYERLKSSDLDWMSSQTKQRNPDEPAAGGWCWLEVEYILLRFRSGIPLAQAIGKTQGRLTKERALSTHARCREAFPFVKTMSALWQRLEGYQCRQEALAKNSLWKRLTFQYHIDNRLPQEDILERISPPAALVGYEIKNINTWIADRLFSDITKWIDKEKSVGSGT